MVKEKKKTLSKNFRENLKNCECYDCAHLGHKNCGCCQ